MEHRHSGRESGSRYPRVESSSARPLRTAAGSSRRRSRSSSWGILLLAFAPLSAHGQSLRVTVDASGLATVVEIRQIEMKKGLSEIIWEGISTQLDMATLQLRSLDRPGTLSVLSQRQDYDLGSRQSLLNRYLGKQVILTRRDAEGKETERLSGTLVSAEGGRISVLLMADGQLRLDPGGEVLLPALPDGPVLSPRLVLKVRSSEEGTYALELAYLTRGISWAPNYNIALSNDGSQAKITGWITLSNSTNANFPDAQWRLVSEEVRRKEAFQPVDESVTVEYRPTGLADPVSLATGASYRVPLASASDVTVEKRLLFDPIGSGPAAPTPPQRLRQISRFRNDTEHGLGIAMPGGRALITREVLFESKTNSITTRPVTDTSIPSTAIGKYFDLGLGEAPGLEGERKQTAFRQIADRVQEQDIEIVLRNKLKDPARVVAVEHPWGNYEIVQKSHEFVKQDDGSIEFNVEIPAGGSVTVTYRMRIKY